MSIKKLALSLLLTVDKQESKDQGQGTTNQEEAEAKCPFGFKDFGPNPHAGTLVKERKNDPASRCPWPFVFFHDPLTGMKDWQTWFMIGIALCWCYSQL
jgi:hypothetical protein